MVEAIYELLISQLAQDGSVNETNNCRESPTNNLMRPRSRKYLYRM